MDYTVHGILQARILEWVAFSFSRGLSQPRNRTVVSCIAGRFFFFFYQLSYYGSQRRERDQTDKIRNVKKRIDNWYHRNTKDIKYINYKNSPKVQEQIDGFSREFYQIFKEELICTLKLLFQKFEEERTLVHEQHHSNNKTRLRHRKKKLQADILDEDRCKYPQQNINKLNSTFH